MYPLNQSGICSAELGPGSCRSSPALLRQPGDPFIEQRVQGPRLLRPKRHTGSQPLRHCDRFFLQRFAAIRNCDDQIPLILR